jgi:ribulose 1,5-bisphosphate carboxylase large subunit-like protein
LNNDTLITVIAVVASLTSILIGWWGRGRTIKQDVTADATKDAELRTDMQYIKRGIDDVRIDQKLQGQRFDQLSERVTRIEESTKSAHRRLDRVEAKGE